jgi:hypothetical protein
VEISWVGLSRRTIQAGELVAECLEISLDGIVLVGWARKVIAETAATCESVVWIESGYFRSEVLGATDGSGVGAGRWQCWNGCWCVLAVVCKAGTARADPAITAGEQRETSRAPSWPN